METSSFLPFLFIPGFIIIWLTVIFILMSKSGLKKLGEKFPYVESRVLEDFRYTWTWKTIRAGGVRFKNAITSKANSDGLLVSPFILFRCFGGRAFIPWEQIKYLDIKSESYWTWHELEIDGILLKIDGTMEGLEEYIQLENSDC